MRTGTISILGRALILCSALGLSGSAFAVDGPDLTLNGRRLAKSIKFETRTFDKSSCDVQEQCVDQAGTRRLLRFDVDTPNIGNMDLVLGDPTSHPELFEYSDCHQHYHFKGYAKYELMDIGGRVLKTGRKRAFCLEDFEQKDPKAKHGKFTCGFQGISAGWSDVYEAGLECQWLDITGIPGGLYRLKVTINPDRILKETRYDNNSFMTPLIISR